MRAAGLYLEFRGLQSCGSFHVTYEGPPYRTTRPQGLLVSTLNTWRVTLIDVTQQTHTHTHKAGHTQ